MPSAAGGGGRSKPKAASPLSYHCLTYCLELSSIPEAHRTLQTTCLVTQADKETHWVRQGLGKESV